MSATPTRDAIAEALRRRGGNLAAAAMDLGVARQDVAAAVESDEGLAAVVDDLRSTLVDLAESKLRMAVSKGEEWAVKYALDSARASPRGWRKPSAAQAAQQGARRPDAAPDFAAMTDDERAAFTRRSLGIEDEGG